MAAVLCCRHGKQRGNSSPPPLSTELAHSPHPSPHTSFFGERQQLDYERLAGAAGVSLREKPLVVGRAGAKAAAGAAERYRGEGGRYARPRAPLAAAGSGDEDGGGSSEEEDEEEVDEATAGDAPEVALPEALSEGEEFDLMEKLHGLRTGSRR